MMQKLNYFDPDYSPAGILCPGGHYESSANPHSCWISDLCPFGMQTPDYQWNTSRGAYRWGFNSMEKDDELKGSGNSYDFGARIYDPRVGRWLAVDPLSGKYPGVSPYCFAINNPIFFLDPNGKDILPTAEFQESEYYEITLQLANSNSIFKKYANTLANNGKGADWILDFGDVSKHASDANIFYYYAYTYPKIKAIYSEDNKFLGTDWATSTTIFNSELKDGIETNIVAKVGTIIHESIHAYLFYENQHTDNFFVSDHHEYMAQFNREDIITGIKEFVNNNNISNISDYEIEILSWSGLTDTNAFYQKYDTSEKRDNYFIELDNIKTKNIEYEK